MTRNHVITDYTRWMYSLVQDDGRAGYISYNKLLTHLHDTDFRYSIPKDQNRAEDGCNLRYRFAMTQGYEDSVDDVLDILDGPCSVLEMMIALCIRCEEDIMDDPSIGGRSKQWFWNMITSLGLNSMTDNRYDTNEVTYIIDRFLDRKYSRNGIGGLFTIKNADRDLRNVEIWYQMCWYLDSIT